MNERRNGSARYEPLVRFIRVVYKVRTCVLRARADRRHCVSPGKNCSVRAVKDRDGLLS